MTLICVQNFKFLPSSVPEILGVPTISEVGHVTQAAPTFGQFLHILFGVPHDINLRAKFQVSSFRRSIDNRGVPKFNSRSRDLGSR